MLRLLSRERERERGSCFPDSPCHAANCDYQRNVNCFTTDMNSNFCPSKNRKQLKLDSSLSLSHSPSLSVFICSAQLQLLATLALLQSGNVVHVVLPVHPHPHSHSISRQIPVETAAEPANYPTHRRYFG